MTSIISVHPDCSRRLGQSVLLGLCIGALALAGCRTTGKSQHETSAATANPPADRTSAASDTLAGSDTERAMQRLDEQAQSNSGGAKRPAAPNRPANRAVDQPRNVGVPRR